LKFILKFFENTDYTFIYKIQILSASVWKSRQSDLYPLMANTAKRVVSSPPPTEGCHGSMCSRLWQPQLAAG